MIQGIMDDEFGIVRMLRIEQDITLQGNDNAWDGQSHRRQAFQPLGSMLLGHAAYGCRSFGPYFLDHLCEICFQYEIFGDFDLVDFELLNVNHLTEMHIGLQNGQRKILGDIDNFLSLIVPPASRYQAALLAEGLLLCKACRCYRRCNNALKHSLVNAVQHHDHGFGSNIGFQHLKRGNVAEL